MPWFLLLLIVPFSIHPPSDAPIYLYSASDSYSKISGMYLEYFEDKESTLNIEEVLSINSFRPSNKEIPNFGISNSTYWLRFRLHNNSSASVVCLSVEQPLLDLVEIYVISRGKPVMLEAISKNTAFFSREYPQINRVFDVPVSPGKIRTVLLKVRSASPIVLPVKIGNEKQLTRLNFKKELWLGIYSGIMLAIIIYNLFIFLSIRDKNYFLYVTYVLSIALTQTTLPGFTFKYLWPEFPFLALQGPTIFSCLTGIAALEFINEFLQVKKFAPRLSIGIPLFQGLFIIAMILSLGGLRMEGFFVMQISTASASLFSLFISYLIYRANYRPAKFFLVAWSILLIGAIAFVLKDFGLIPYNHFTTSALLISSALEALLLSFALADKISLLRKEKAESQEQAMVAMAEIARITREQNILLEMKVNERTIALKEANMDLSKAMQELKEAESQLVESEKMASLGQLTAGIAHEINNPTNFVTSNVNPLKRDIAMIIQLLEEIEEIALSPAATGEKQSLMKKLKDNLDYEYLKTEIDHLINGIREGSNRTAEIVKGLHSFSRLDEDNLKKASVNEGIDSTLIIVNHMLHGRIKIIKNFGDLPFIECHPGKLNQVFLNIITNALQAIKAKFENRTGGTLVIATWDHGAEAAISFKDNGTGMDRVTMDKIFEPFFTTKKANEGIGLGMSIVYNIIQKHKGRIEIQSQPGEGTEFLIILPITHDDSGI